MTEDRGFLAILLTTYLSKEDSKSIALILSQLDPLLSADVLSRLHDGILSDEVLTEVIVHLGSMGSGKFREELSQEIKTTMLDKLLDDAGGPKVVAEILNRMGPTMRRKALKQLEAQDPELAESVVNEMYAFDDLARWTNPEIQILLQEVDTKDLAIALKAASKELTDRIFSNASEEAGNKIKEEMELAGPVRMIDVKDAQLRIKETVRLLEEKRQVKVVRGESGDIFV